MFNFACFNVIASLSKSLLIDTFLSLSLTLFSFSLELYDVQDSEEREFTLFSFYCCILNSFFYGSLLIDLHQDFTLHSLIWIFQYNNKSQIYYLNVILFIVKFIFAGQFSLYFYIYYTIFSLRGYFVIHFV